MIPSRFAVNKACTMQTLQLKGPVVVFTTKGPPPRSLIEHPPGGGNGCSSAQAAEAQLGRPARRFILLYLDNRKVIWLESTAPSFTADIDYPGGGGKGHLSISA